MKPVSGAGPVAASATLVQVTMQRDAFVQRLRKDGFTCPIAAPTITVEDVPSFGQYNPETNTLRTSDWALLSPPEKAFFLQLAGPNSDDAAAHAVFEKAAHRWIFVHEMGHWWQACQRYEGQPYAVEYGANRIALAYWRESDPSIPMLMSSLFHQVMEHQPSPVPDGQEVEAYFNKNYEALGPTPAYPWFQSQMNVRLEQEKPAPTLDAVLAATKK